MKFSETSLVEMSDFQIFLTVIMVVAVAGTIYVDRHLG